MYVLEVYMISSSSNNNVANDNEPTGTGNRRDDYGNGNIDDLATSTRVVMMGLPVYNLTSHDAPHFEMAGLAPGTTYRLAAYAANVKGQSAKILFNVTTLNLAEKRTAETPRSKVGAVIDEQGKDK